MELGESEKGKEIDRTLVIPSYYHRAYKNVY
jgi:hypothetical protein